MCRPPLPPFTVDTAAQKARLGEDAWNSRDPQRIALAYTEDSAWRNRAEFPRGRAEAQAFFMAAVNGAFGGKVVPVPGGVLVMQDGAVIGAVGVTGDTSDNDAAAGVAGIEAAAFTALA